jgi:hypothetical protein
VGPQSVEVESSSASAISFSLRSEAADRCVSSSAKWARRCLSKAVRAWLNRFQSRSSVFRSSRAAAFHSSSSVRNRSPVRFQSVEARSVSASATMASLTASASWRAAWRTASASLRRSAI